MFDRISTCTVLMVKEVHSTIMAGVLGVVTKIHHIYPKGIPISETIVSTIDVFHLNVTNIACKTVIQY